MEKCYGDVEAAMELQKTQYSFIIGDFNARVGKKSVGMTPLRNFKIDTQNYSSDIIVEFAEKKNLKIMKTFFDRKTSKKWI